MNPRTSLIAAFLLMMTGFAMANPSGDDPPPPQAEDQYRRDARMLMKHLYDENPAKFEALMDMRRNNPQEFRAVMKKMLGEKRASGFGTPVSDAENQKRRERREDFRDALTDHVSASGKDKAKTLEQLNELAAEIFDAKQERRRAKVDTLRTELQNLESEIAERDANREALIEDFVSMKIKAAESRGL